MTPHQPGLPPHQISQPESPQDPPQIRTTPPPQIPPDSPKATAAAGFPQTHRTRSITRPPFRQSAIPRIFLTFLIASSLCALIWHKATRGPLAESEHSARSAFARLIQFRPPASQTSPPLLVQLDHPEGTLPSALDAALFLRAARVLNAKTAAIAAFALSENPQSLASLHAASALPWLSGCMLLKDPESSGPPPLLATAETLLKAQLPSLPKFQGHYSAFPENGQSGFLNLISSENATLSAALLADLNGSLALSFAASLQALAAGTRPVWRPSPDGTHSLLSFGTWHLKLSQDGALPLDSSLFDSLERIPLDDLLLEAERTEQKRATASNQPPLNSPPPSPISGRTLILSPSSRPPAQHHGSPTPISPADFHALALATLRKHLSPAPLPQQTSLLFLLAASLVATLAASIASARGASLPARIAIVMVTLCAWLLLSALSAHTFKTLPPLLAPALTLLSTLLIPRSLLPPAPKTNAK